MSLLSAPVSAQSLMTFYYVTIVFFRRPELQSVCEAQFGQAVAERCYYLTQWINDANDNQHLIRPGINNNTLN